MALTLVIGIGFPILILLIMYLFGLFTNRNAGWVAVCLLWGAAGYFLGAWSIASLTTQGADAADIKIYLVPLLQQALVSLGVFFVLYSERYDNLIDGAVYGWAAGLGFEALEFIELGIAGISSGAEPATQTLIASSFSSALVYATASAITGLAMTQYYFRHRPNRLIVLLSGIGAAVGYTALFNWLMHSGADPILPVVYSITGLTLMSLYITGRLRSLIIQLGVQKKRADGLLDIVIPIGVKLSVENNFQNLLESMLVEAKTFCNADAGTLYLKKNDSLEFAVVRNDSLKIAMGGTSGNEVSLPPIELHDTEGNPNRHNIAAYAALTGEIVNIEDSYEDKRFDFAGTREFDQRTGYISASFLTIPLKDSEGNVQGVLQLLNALDSRRRTIIPFDQNLQQLMTSFSSLASAALEGYIEEQKLRSEIRDLRIEIDKVKRDKQVAEITDSSYFKELQEKAKNFRERDSKPAHRDTEG